jgi:hypothetical protein
MSSRIDAGDGDGGGSGVVILAVYPGLSIFRDSASTPACPLAPWALPPARCFDLTISAGTMRCFCHCHCNSRRFSSLDFPYTTGASLEGNLSQLMLFLSRRSEVSSDCHLLTLECGAKPERMGLQGPHVISKESRPLLPIRIKKRWCSLCHGGFRRHGEAVKHRERPGPRRSFPLPASRAS